MKTPMQKIRFKANEYAENSTDLRVKKAYLDIVCAIDDYNLIEEEKQIIISSATHGANFDISPYSNAHEYYEKEFNNN